MTSVTLNCLVVGEDPYEKTLPVDIDINKNIGALKKAIKNDIGGSMSARDLKLFRVDIPLGSTRNENVVAMLKTGDLSVGVEMNNNLEKISVHFSTQPADTNLHILVQLPTVAFEQPVAASVENLANLIGQLDVSGGSGSVGTPSLSMILKAVADNSEITRKSSETMAKNSETMAKSSETMVRFMKELNRIEHETASITRARAYQRTVFESVDEEYFLNKNNTYLGEFKSSGSVDMYLRNNPVPTNSEDDVQEWFNKLMESLPRFSRRLTVKDTHTNTYLNGLKPDLSVFMEEDAINDVYLTMFVQTLLEVKKRKNMSGLVDEDKGQVLDYIRILMQQQPLRELFAVFLSDGFYFYVMAYDRKTKKYSEFTTNLRTGLRLFWVLLNFNSPFTTMVGPRSINFMTSQGNFKIRLKGYLGVGSTSTVYKIDWENTPSVIKVFKPGYKSKNEVQALQFLNEENFPNVPTYVAHDENSIIIRPVCERIGDQFQVSHAQQLLRLLIRIHSMGIIHRDVRPENILLDTDNNILILADWGSSIRDPTMTTVNYEGTITFASPNILNNNFGPYIPKASDDLHSFVRTIYILRNPSAMPTIHTGNFALKARAIKEYWNDEKLDGPLWTEMVNSAENKDYGVLEKCCCVFNK